MIVCDLCGAAKECSQRHIEGKEYDICSGCWQPLVERLQGKGRAKKDREIVLLPSTTPSEGSESKPAPGEPPKIWSGAGRLH